TLLVGTALPDIASAACPPLESYYPVTANDWFGVTPQLEAMMSECLDSAEYFALLGAAQLNTGAIADSLESLERALLIDPMHGAALTDYAQALFVAGQLFPALEINRSLLQRSDL